ncbi:hypothetical protein CL614_10515 [archaeon]|nr:hypothetical protein [archaeon]|tara:strand:- start:218 stop:823 length:606 start_codon:yes stop_codon:yes gene_type:complete
MRYRTDIINFLIKNYNLKSYLEVGTHDPNRNFNKIKIKYKECVDPNPKNKSITFKMTSDEFFQKIDKNKKYDIIFIDGLHQENQVDKDIQNSLDHLSGKGFIIMHDCNPISEYMQREVQGRGYWNGTVWKSWVKLRCTRGDLKMLVVNIDHGCGVIHRGGQNIWNKFTNIQECTQYSYLDKYRSDLLNLVSVNKFKELYNV